jgi:predicted nucleic acid-binding protein
MQGLVIDTNVFVAAGFNPRSASARVLAGVRDGRLLLIWNKPTRSETEMILRRIPRLNWESFADLFRLGGEFTGPVYPEAFTLIADPDDRKFAALSAAAKSPLVTNDSDILDQRNFIEIEVFTPSEFLLQWEKSLSKRVVIGNFGDPQ